MFGDYSPKEFLIWVASMVAIVIAVLGMIYVVNNFVIPESDGLTADSVRRK
jgi:hypothetical protein